MTRQKSHSLRDIHRLCHLPQRHRTLALQIQLPRIIQTIADELSINPAGGDSVDPGLRIELHNLVLDGRHETVLQTSLAARILRVPCLAELAALASRYHDSQVLELLAGTVLVGLGGEQEVLDRQVGPANIDAVDILPCLQRQLPDARMRGFVRDTGIGAEDVDRPILLDSFLYTSQDGSLV